jgi:hypothetical protein
VTPIGPELARLLEQLHPAELGLRDWVRTRLNASIVRDLAALDHGMRVDEHRRGIEELLVARRLPDDLPWTPREVLELAGHTVVPDPHPTPGSAGWRGHVARLFACVVLVRTGGTVLPAGTLAGLVESALALGPEATGHAVHYLAWCRLQLPGGWRDDDEARPLLTLGLLLVYAAGQADRHPHLDAALRRACTDDARSVEPQWPGQPPAAVLKAATGGNAWRTWRALVDRGLTTDADGPIRAWFGLADA